MYLFLSDETNTAQSDAVQFLIFGAMVIPMENAPAAVKEVLEIRQSMKEYVWPEIQVRIGLKSGLEMLAENRWTMISQRSQYSLHIRILQALRIDA